MSGKGFCCVGWVKVCVVAMGVAVFMAWCSPGIAQTAKAAKPVTIGVIEPLTGPAAAGGKWLKMAWELAVEKINAEGGIKSLGGAPIKLVFGDHQGKQEVAISEVERLIQQEKVSVVGGAQLSGIVVAATTVTERLQVPFVVDVPAAAPITERGLKYVFRTNINGRTYGKTFVALAKELNTQGANIKKVALAYPDTEAAKSFLGAAGQEARAGGLDVVFDEAYPLDMQDFTTLLTKVKVRSPDIIGTNDSHVSQAIQYVKQAADIKLKPKLFISANGTVEFPDWSAGVGKLKDGYSIMVQWNPDLPGANKLADEFYNKYKEPINGHAALGVQAAYVVAEALELAKSSDPKLIRDALAKVRINPGPRLVMPFPFVQFDETGQNIGARCIVVQWQGEQRVTVYPKEVATKKIIVPFDYWSAK